MEEVKVIDIKGTNKYIKNTNKLFKDYRFRKKPKGYTNNEKESIFVLNWWKK